MNKALSRLMLTLVLGIMAFGVSAQQMPEIPKIPADTAVRVGKLDNGLTYYIRHNEKPKGQADFYIAQKVGSILEEENQRGLAHFLEHMCFNGTQNFPGNSLITWLESIGVKFGRNLNAYTSVDETVYNIANVPTARESVQDSVLLILHDWADGLTLDPEEIDKERGVIHSEWLTTNVGQQRIIERLLPTIMSESRYGYRLPIGTIEVIDNFPPQLLRDYYETWYRPDQQGIIVVGDIDVDRIEAKIKELFSPIEMPANPKKREYVTVPENKGTIYAVGSDPEQPIVLASMCFKNDAMPDSLANTVLALSFDFMRDMTLNMLNARLQEMTTKSDAPFSVAQVSYGPMLGITRTMDGLTLTVVPKDGDAAAALAAAYREVLRAAKGFNASEYDRAKQEYLSRIEKRYNDRANLDNDYYVNQILPAFIRNDYMPSIDDRYQMANQMAMFVNVNQINTLLPELIGNDNRVVFVMYPEGKEGVVVPTEESLAAAIKAVDGEKIEAYVDQVKTDPLIPGKIKAGKIVATDEDKQWDAEVWTLSNGAKVIVKPTTFKHDEILFNAVAKGGTAQLPDSLASTVITMPLAMSQSGLGTYTNSDLQKYLQGKQVAVEFSMDDYNTSVSGMSTPKDLETLMELIHMAFVDAEITDDEFAALQSNYASLLHNQESNPQFAFQKKVHEHLVASPKGQFLSSGAILGADREAMLDIVHRAASNAADYTFVFVGNVDTKELKPLVEKYIASLPGDAATARTSVEWNPAMEFATGNAIYRDSMAMQSPQAFAMIAISGNIPYNIKNHKAASVAAQILTKRLLDSVREREGAVYSIQAVGGLDYEGANNAKIQIPFPLKPEMTDKVLVMIKDELQAMTQNITEAELNAIKEYLVKQYTENRELNGPWLQAITDNAISGVDVFNGNIEAVNALTVADIQQYVADLIGQGNYQVVLLEPAQ